MTDQQLVDGDTARSAPARFPSGAAIVTTRGESIGTPHGFTARSSCASSLDPPLVLVCPPTLLGTAAVTRCRREDVVPAGDHVILVGRVHDARVGTGAPAVWYRGGLFDAPGGDA